MTNPYQRGGSSSGSGPSGYHPDPLHLGQRRTSYASVASGGGAFIHRPSGFSHLLNPASPADGYDTAILTYPPTSRGSGDTPTDSRNGTPHHHQAGGGGIPASRYPFFRNPQLPHHSRAFEGFFRPTLHDYVGHSSQISQQYVHNYNLVQKQFFIPSYLEGTTYAQKLKDAHRARLAALRENATSTAASGGMLQGQTGGAGGTGGGGGSGVIIGSSGNGYVAPRLQARSRHSHHNQGYLSGGGSPGGISADAPKLVVGAATPGSHRGLAFDVVEKPPLALEDDEVVTPLPSRWNKDDKCTGLDVAGEGLEVKYLQRPSGDRGDRDHEACSIRADHPIPPECGIYYFEVYILSTKKDETTIGIGFAGKHVALSRPPGWEPDSWGYHGDDGHTFASQTNGKHYGPTYSAGDTIGCGINFRTGSAFFTKNGLYLGPAFRDVKGQLFPCVGLKKTGNHVRVNFGQTPFVFAIDAMMEDEKKTILQEIDKTSTRGLAPPLDESELVQQLVLQFLQHDGYVETARSFAEEVQAQKQALCLDPNQVVEGSNIMDDDDANNRQRIRRAILEGDIDRALKYTNAFYPQVLKDNEHVHFRLRCRKFIEMIRREAELNLVGGGGDKGSSSNGSLDYHTAQDMDLDNNHQLAAGAAAASGASSWDHMDTEDAYESGGGRNAGEPGSAGAASSSSAIKVILNEALTYGQNLQAEYKDDPRRDVQKTLDDIFSLMAYANPLKEKDVAHLLDRKGRVAVAEELNSAILLSLGKSERSALENMWAQTTVLLEDLRQDGGPGSFVSISDYVDQIHQV